MFEHLATNIVVICLFNCQKNLFIICEFIYILIKCLSFFWHTLHNSGVTLVTCNFRYVSFFILFGLIFFKCAVVNN